MMNSRIRVLAVSAIILLGMTAQAQACFWPFCGYGRPVAWGGPVGYGRPVAYRRGFYAGYYAATSCYSPCSTCSSCGVGGCSTCGVSTYYGPSCCSTCGSACCGGCSTCGTGGCANCSTNYYPDGSSTNTNSTYADDEPTEATTGQPRDDDFGPGNRSTNNSTIESESEADSIPDDFQSPINPAPGEPTNGEEPPMARPLQVSPQLTWQVLPTRSRVNVEAEIRTPRVARVEAAPASAPDLSVLRVASFEE